MFGRQENKTYVPTGTTSPIYIPRGLEPKAIRPGESYFYHSSEERSGSIYRAVLGRRQQHDCDVAGQSESSDPGQRTHFEPFNDQFRSKRNEPNSWA